MIPFFLARGRYSKLVREFPTEAAKFREAATKAMEREAVTKYGDASSPAKAKWLSDQRKQIGSIERDIERSAPKMPGAFNDSLRRIELGNASQADRDLIGAVTKEKLTTEQRALMYQGDPVQEALFQRAAERVRAKQATADDIKLVKDVVISQKTELRAKAWPEYTKNWTEEEKLDWKLNIERVLGIEGGTRVREFFGATVRGELNDYIRKHFSEVSGDRKLFMMKGEQEIKDEVINPKLIAWGRYIRTWGLATDKGLTPAENARYEMLQKLDDLVLGKRRDRLHKDILIARNKSEDRLVSNLSMKWGGKSFEETLSDVSDMATALGLKSRAEVFDMMKALGEEDSLLVTRNREGRRESDSPLEKLLEEEEGQ